MKTYDGLLIERLDHLIQCDVCNMGASTVLRMTDTTRNGVRGQVAWWDICFSCLCGEVRGR